MRKLRKILAGLLVLMLAAPALAEPMADGFTEIGGQNAWDDSGEWGIPDAYGVYDQSDGAFQPQNADVYDADLTVGYVATQNALVSPFYCNDWDLVSLNQLVFESLVELDENQKPSPMLADNWKHEGTTWTFTIRSGISFHNGMELTAYDVQTSYEQFIAAGKESNPYTARLNLLIDDMTALDDRTLSVEANYSGYITLYAMTFPVVQSGTILDDMPRGTGPYWYVRYDMNSLVRIEANPLWWKKQSTIGSIVFRRYEDAGSGVEALQTNQIEMFSTHSPTAAISRKLSDLTSMDYGTTVYEMLVPNLSEKSTMSDLRVRTAVMYAIDRAVLASNAYLDMAVQSEVPILPGTWLYESQSAKYYYSPERALQLLYDAGWADLTGDMILNKVNGVQLQELTVEIITYNEAGNSIRKNAAEMIAGYLNAVGMKATVEVMDMADFKKAMKNGEYDLALLGMNLSEVPVLTKLLGSEGSANMNNYSDVAMDDLIKLTATEEDEASTKAAYSLIQMKLVDELPILGMLFRSGTVLSSRSLGGLKGIRALHSFRGLEYLSE